MKIKVGPDLKALNIIITESLVCCLACYTQYIFKSCSDTKQVKEKKNKYNPVISIKLCIVVSQKVQQRSSYIFKLLCVSFVNKS